MRWHAMAPAFALLSAAVLPWFKSVVVGRARPGLIAIALCAMAVAHPVAANADVDRRIPGSGINVQRTWFGGGYAGDNGAFQYCAVLAQYPTVVVTFALTADFDRFIISLANPQWDLPTDAELTANITSTGNGRSKSWAKESSDLTVHASTWAFR